jgi:hypothetical protein
MQSHGAPLMRFDFRQSVTVSTPLSARGADAVGGRVFAPALRAEIGAGREPRLEHHARVRTGDLAAKAVAAGSGEL